MNRKFICSFCAALLCSACGQAQASLPAETTAVPSAVPSVSAEPEITALPEKEHPESSSMLDSPLNPRNIDDYLFLDGVSYIDTRSFEQVVKEGSIAGFQNISFYEMIAAYKPEENVLFTMDKVRDEDGNVTAALGDPGSFTPNYEESEQILEELFPQDHSYVFIASAGVESAYMINLLIQYGWDPSKLYNCGSFSNGMGNDIAYRDYEGAEHYIPGTDSYTVTTAVDWGEVTPVQN